MFVDMQDNYDANLSWTFLISVFDPCISWGQFCGLIFAGKYGSFCDIHGSTNYLNWGFGKGSVLGHFDWLKADFTIIDNTWITITFFYLTSCSPITSTATKWDSSSSPEKHTSVNLCRLEENKNLELLIWKEDINGLFALFIFERTLHG